MSSYNQPGQILDSNLALPTHSTITMAAGPWLAAIPIVVFFSVVTILIIVTRRRQRFYREHPEMLPYITTYHQGGWYGQPTASKFHGGNLESCHLSAHHHHHHHHHSHDHTTAMDSSMGGATGSTSVGGMSGTGSSGC